MLITIKELKKYLPIRPGDVAYDAILTDLIKAVSSKICKACRQDFSAVERTEILDVRHGSESVYDLTGFSQDGIIDRSPGFVQLSYAPIDTTKPFSVYYDIQRLFGPETLLDPSLINLMPDRGIFYVATTIMTSENTMKVTYTGGSSAPEEVKMACIEQAMYEFKRTQFENAGSSTQNNDDASNNKTEWATKGGLLPTVVAAIGPYRKLLRGRR